MAQTTLDLADFICPDCRTAKQGIEGRLCFNCENVPRVRRLLSDPEHANNSGIAYGPFLAAGLGLAMVLAAWMLF